MTSKRTKTTKSRISRAAIAAVACLALPAALAPSASAGEGGAICHLQGRIAMTSHLFHTLGVGSASCVGTVDGVLVDPSAGSFTLSGHYADKRFGVMGSGTGHFELTLQKAVDFFGPYDIPASGDFRFTRVASVLDLLGASGPGTSSTVQEGVARLLSQGAARAIDIVVRISDNG